MSRYINVDKLISSIESSKIKNKSAIIKIVNEQPYKIIVDYTEDSNLEENISCSDCVYYPDKSPCQYCEGYNNFIPFPF